MARDHKVQMSCVACLPWLPLEYNVYGKCDMKCREQDPSVMSDLINYVKVKCMVYTLKICHINGGLFHLGIILCSTTIPLISPLYPINHQSLCVRNGLL